jgi:hypothetical protein
MRCAVIDQKTGEILNVIIADLETDPAPDGTALMRVGVSPITVGWSYADGVFTQTIAAKDIAEAVAVEDVQLETAQVLKSSLSTLSPGK